MIGIWVGGLAAMWGKIIGGMAGLNIDWLLMAGQSLDIQRIAIPRHSTHCNPFSGSQLSGDTIAHY